MWAFYTMRRAKRRHICSRGDGTIVSGRQKSEDVCCGGCLFWQLGRFNPGAGYVIPELPEKLIPNCPPMKLGNYAACPWICFNLFLGLLQWE
jgi:hypothetical protein